MPVPVQAALKLAVVSAFLEAGISKSELARRMEKAENEARRILDPLYPTKVPTLESALNVLGRQAIVDVVGSVFDANASTEDERIRTRSRT